MKHGLRRWGVFNLVGLGGFVLQVGTLALLTRGLEWPTVIATAVALEIAALHNFLGHSRWTWRDYHERTLRGRAFRFLRYQAAKTASLGANLAITMALTAGAGLPVEMANVVAVLLCALPNYLIADRLVFSTRPDAGHITVVGIRD